MICAIYSPVVVKVTPYNFFAYDTFCLKAYFLAHTLPDDHSASEVSKENTSGNVPKVTQHYPASVLGTGWDRIE